MREDPYGNKIEEIPDETPKEPRYEVHFYDAFDGWSLYPYKATDDLEEATEYADEQYRKLASGNKGCGEHYGVIDTKTGIEIYCTQYKG